MSVLFIWNAEKARVNRVKHGVSFEEARSVFADERSLSWIDEHVIGEERWITLGEADGFLLLIVVHVDIQDDDDSLTIRIISARRATKHERRRYEAGK